MNKWKRRGKAELKMAWSVVVDIFPDFMKLNDRCRVALQTDWPLALPVLVRV